MSSKIDSSIIRALSLDAATAKIASHGGSGFASTYRITTPETSYFVKTSTSSGAEVMFKGENASLNAIYSAVPNLCPSSPTWGPLQDSRGFYLVTEFLDLNGGRAAVQPSRPRKNNANSNADVKERQTLACKLAKLHSTPAPIPDGHDKPQFGFPVSTCCGETPQPNDYDEDWASFFARSRILAILERAEKLQGRDASLRSLLENVAENVVPRLLGKGHLGGAKGITPVVVHGDLWSGNKGRAVFVGRGRQANIESEVESEEELGAEAELEDVVFDPSATYAHSEYDHGIMNMFGGFDHKFWSEYFDAEPKTEPRDEYGDRVALYESYHHLNHYAMFGGGYKGGAVSLLKPLVAKYGR